MTSQAIPMPLGSSLAPLHSSDFMSGRQRIMSTTRVPSPNRGTSIGSHKRRIIGKATVEMARPFAPSGRHSELPGVALGFGTGKSQRPCLKASDLRGEVVMQSQTKVSTAAVPADAGEFFGARMEMSEGQGGQQEGRANEAAENQRLLFAREARISAAQQQIEAEIRQRGEKLREAALVRKLDSELKFGKLLFSQEKYDAALAHFEKVLSQSQPLSNQSGDATYWKAQCLEHVGRKGEAKEAYESLLFFRAPFPPHLRRRAAQAAEQIRSGGSSSSKAGGNPVSFSPVSTATSHRHETSSSSTLPATTEDSNATSAPAGVSRGGQVEDRPAGISEYMYRLYTATKDGYATYYPSKEEKYEESKEERALTNLVTASMLLMGPLLIGVMIWANGGGGGQ
eukprot:TRINITY_DN30449_c0_g1_i1.p1 TRINITY_DN30449_c0_g1~~TRINITY_DN30449_c0_g1_i1.p1  ORF type:complete len:397 (+),score=96.63 TRINITY_DN30449_c0_g1_i1:316-1506(+)